MSLQRREIFFSGRVQGVGFRYTTTRIAANHDVTGIVENLGDGRVRVIVEGRRTAIDSLLQDIQAAMESNIDGRQSFDSEYSGEFDGFVVRHGLG